MAVSYQLVVDCTSPEPLAHFSIKNRIHIDVNASGGRGTPLDARRERVEAEAARLVSLGATRLHTNVQEGLDHYAVALTDPEGNEFDIN
jgi:hypothetical protein